MNRHIKSILYVFTAVPIDIYHTFYSMFYGIFTWRSNKQLDLADRVLFKYNSIKKKQEEQAAKNDWDD